MNIAVWYHCKLSGSGIPDANLAQCVVNHQLAAIRASGLSDASREVHVGLNGTGLEELELCAQLYPNWIVHRHDECGEQATIATLQQWLPDHPGWLVCYHHAKGVTHPGDAYAHWRNCMERAVIWNWEACVGAMINGCDTVGAHWFTYMDQRYWAGNFWWAKADYLSQLPPVSHKTLCGKSYEAECWIGKCSGTPAVLDFAPHPILSGCQ